MAQTARIMVVEDEILVLLSLVDLLADHGLEAVPFGRADTAAKGKGSIDALITDIDLPGAMSGLELAWQMAADRPDMPIVVVSGGHKPKPADLPHNAVFLSKPYRSDEILAALHLPVHAVAA
jgi:FixJ family two-component response regulator